VTPAPDGQPPSPVPSVVSCTFAIPDEHRSREVSAAGGTFSVPITTQPGCNWVVATAAAFVIADPASGIGNGSVQIAVAPNTGEARSTPVTIAGENVSLRQEARVQVAPGCEFVVTPEQIAASAAGGTVSIGVSGAGKTCVCVDSNDVRFLPGE
jgi:hypothetical protein